MLLPTAALSTTGAWAPADHATTATSVRATAGMAMRVMAPPDQALAGHRVHSRAVTHDEEANDAEDDIRGRARGPAALRERRRRRRRRDQAGQRRRRARRRERARRELRAGDRPLGEGDV